jgi:hypothetical protein
LCCATIIIYIYISRGNLNYLLELDYSKTDIKYKDSVIKSNLKQDDITLVYGKYFSKYMFKVGMHHINTTDTDLGDGDTIIFTIGGYKWKGYDKHSYGIENYYTKFKDGHDENFIAKSINVIQFTPYYSFSKAININTRNNIDFKINYIKADDYNTKSYTSYEISDTLYYKKFFTTIKAYGGKMKTGVKDNGFTVYNSKDELKDGYNIKIGYNFKPNLLISSSYGVNNFTEFSKTEDTTSKVLTASLTYTF